MILASALSRGLTPINMEEARQTPPTFILTFRTWVLVQLIVVVASIGFALVGDVVINLLTNGKFTDAHLIAYLLIIGCAVQTAGKAESSLLLANGHGRPFARLQILAIACCALALIVLIPWIGATGAPIAVLVRGIVIRVGIVPITRAHYRVPFRDGFLLAGIAASAAVAFWVFAYQPTLVWRLIAAFPTIAAGLVLVYRLQNVLRQDAVSGAVHPYGGDARELPVAIPQ
jgi:O-antigen/teichoic acid export membrane protein